MTMEMDCHNLFLKLGKTVVMHETLWFQDDFFGWLQTEVINL
jgi:hypothetical protein